MIYEEIEKIIYYALIKGLLKETDRYFAINAILDILNLDDMQESGTTYENVELESTLKNILDWAVENSLIDDSITERDLLDTKIMGVITPRPSEIIEIFEDLNEQDPRMATDYFYNLSIDSDYIRKYRIEKDQKWMYSSKYGELDITINLSKPEKDPKAIAAAKLQKQSGYPKCLLCKENVGYKGRLNHPARQNLRAIPICINDEDWYFQYSPYVYYNEHCIVFCAEHKDMKIEKATFRKLLDFVKLFPHYFVGSNADLPIVGGSILTHDHFQGGNYEFAMERAKVQEKVEFNGFSDVEAGIVDWPMSVIRLSSEDDSRLVELADKILLAWRDYSDENAFVFAETNGEKHNTITPIARMKNGKYELDLVLRNNITTEEHPMGVYHPHSELHNIKKENIGLIEVMGLAVLPARLLQEIDELSSVLVNKEEIPEALSHHSNWAKELSSKYNEFTTENIDDIMRDEIGLVFEKVLEHAGVYKNNVDFIKFIKSV